MRLPPHIAALHAYTPGTQPTGTGWIKLNTNELPYPPSPRVADALQREVEWLRLYPSPTSQPLRAALARHHGVGEDQVIVGNGSDDLLNLLCRAYAGPEHPVGQTSPSYTLYPVLAAVQRAPVMTVEFGDDFHLPVDELARLPVNLLFLTSPNAPSGVAFPPGDIQSLLRQSAALVVVDEAYVDFAPESALPLLASHPNLVITRTFSKSHGLAGLRLGYALAAPEVIAVLDRVRESYNVNRLSQAAGLAALEDQEHFRLHLGRVISTRDAFLAQLRELGWFVYPSATNFVFARPRDRRGREGPEVAQRCHAFLTERRILVRAFPKHPLTAPFLRISIGTDAQMRLVTHSLHAWQESDR